MAMPRHAAPEQAAPEQASPEIVLSASVERGASGEPAGANGLNGHGFDLDQLLGALQAMRMGDFSIRLPGNQVGIEGKIADTFNEIVAANERMAQQLDHVGEVVGREGKSRPRGGVGLCNRAWGGI
jgi:hypothetical protein